MNFFATVGKKGVVLLEKPSLVLEGGTFRPIFSSGAMDALLDHDVTFPYCVGVSAGISDGVSYLSKQRGRNLEIVRRFRNDPRYIGVRNFFTCKSLFGLDFVFREIPQKWIPFDYETFRSYEGTCLVGVTNARTGKTEYFHGQEDGEQFQFLRATCAIPLFSLLSLLEKNGIMMGALPIRSLCEKPLLMAVSGILSSSLSQKAMRNGWEERIYLPQKECIAVFQPLSRPFWYGICFIMKQWPFVKSWNRKERRCCFALPILWTVLKRAF